MKANVIKRGISFLLAVCLSIGLAGCGGNVSKESGKKPVILAVSFGTSYNDSREATIGAIENALQAANPEYEVRRAFTSQTVIDILAERDGIDIYNVKEAMESLVSDGVKDVVIQPTHVMPGFEYDDIVAEVESYADKFESFKISSPLLSSDEDYSALAECIANETKEYNTEGTAIVYMGHGTEHEANATYLKLQKTFEDKGFANYFVGTVEAEPDLEDVMELVSKSGAQRVVLLPLMIVAGDHASNDMAGDEEDSWKSQFEAEGYEVECVLKGLGEYSGVHEIFAEHVKAAAAE